VIAKILCLRHHSCAEQNQVSGIHRLRNASYLDVFEEEWSLRQSLMHHTQFRLKEWNQRFKELK
jgi:hypothetical protein